MNFNELLMFLRNGESAEQLDEKRSEIVELIPEVSVMFDYDQKDKNQCDDLWIHSLNTVARLPKDLPDEDSFNLLYLAALLHDIGKPQTAAPDKRNSEYQTYKDHAKAGAAILTEKIIPRLNAEEEVVSPSSANTLKYYISQHHELSFRVKKFVRRQLSMATLEELENLLILQIADCKAQYKNQTTKDRVELCEYILRKSKDDVTGLFTFTKWMV